MQDQESAVREKGDEVLPFKVDLPAAILANASCSGAVELDGMLPKATAIHCRHVGAWHCKIVVRHVQVVYLSLA